MDDDKALKLIDTALRHITGFRKLEPQLRELRQQIVDRGGEKPARSTSAFIERGKADVSTRG